MTGRPDAVATQRNRQPILEVLQHELHGDESVLEIGSGTGQHAVYFASEMPGLTWQTSDVAENHAGIEAWREWSGLSNVVAPLLLDVADCPPLERRFEAVFSANTAHIMTIGQAESMFVIAGGVLAEGGIFCLYGPFNRNGEFSSDSNAQFDRSLKLQNPSMGIRDLADLERFAGHAGLHRERLYAMPANNLLAVWRKGAGAEPGPGQDGE